MQRTPCYGCKLIFELMEDSRTCSIFDSRHPVAAIEPIWSISRDVRGSSILYVTDHDYRLSIASARVQVTNRMSEIVLLSLSISQQDARVSGAWKTPPASGDADLV
jgi:hypothetical protein